MTLTNISATGCYLLGYPTVKLADANGHALAFKYSQRGDLEVTKIPPQRVYLLPAHTAYATINKYRCDQGDAAITTTVSLTPPGDSTPLALHPRAVDLGFCKPGAGGVTVAVSPIEPSFQATLSAG